MTTCSMPDHGSSTAQSACCRPSSPSYMGDVTPARPLSGQPLIAEVATPTAGFWNDLPTWRRAGFNTFSCLVGCSIGNFGMMFYLGVFYPGMAVPLMMAMAMASGITTSIALETVVLRVREGFAWKKSLTTAFSMSLISMLSMEFAATTTDYVLTGGSVDFAAPWFWGALAISLVVGFLTPLPYNYYMLRAHGHACH